MKKIFLFLCAVFMAASTVARAAECNVEHCSECHYLDNYCTSCENGWTTSEGKCYQLLDHCISQVIDSSKNRKCAECETGWVSRQCPVGQDCGCVKNTVEHCASKSDWDQKQEQETGYKRCSSCEKGYGYSEGIVARKTSDDECVPCKDKNALDCRYLYAESTDCKSGYVLQTKQCYKEIPNCAKYEGAINSDSYCVQCKDGYTLTAHMLSGPFGSISGKKTCEKETIETPCPENAVCSDGNVTCNSGYELKDGACVKPACPANCSACSSSTACTACDSGYSLIGGKCVAGTVAKCPPDSSISPDGCCCVPN